MRYSSRLPADRPRCWDAARPSLLARESIGGFVNGSSFEIIVVEDWEALACPALESGQAFEEFLVADVLIPVEVAVLTLMFTDGPPPQGHP